MANILHNSFNGWVSKLNGRADLKAARLSDVLTGEQVETMINGLIKCDKYDSFPEDVKTKILNYRRGRAANIVALLKDSGFVATKHNARTAAAILCHAIPVRGSATHYIPDARMAPLGIDEATDVDPAVLQQAIRRRVDFVHHARRRGVEEQLEDGVPSREAESVQKVCWIHIRLLRSD